MKHLLLFLAFFGTVFSQTIPASPGVFSLSGTSTGGSGTPGGVSGDWQYNNAGAFGGFTPATGWNTLFVTPTSANLSAWITNETGTGALVFATSPTLVTPVLGAATGTSLVLTGGVTTGSGGGVAGAAWSIQGTAPTPPANSIGYYSPASVATAYGISFPSAPTTGVVLRTGSTSPQAETIIAPSTSGNVLTSNGTTWVSSAGATGITLSKTVTSTGHGLTVGTLYGMWNSTGTTWVKASASSTGLGKITGVAQPIDANTFTLIESGDITTTGLTAGAPYYLTDDGTGLLTTTKPTTTTSFIVPVLIAGSTTLAAVQIGSPAALALIGTNDINFGLTENTTTALTVTTAMDYVTTNNAASVTATLPTLASAIAANPTKIYHVKNLGAGSANWTRNGSDTIFYLSAGQTVITLATGESCDFVATATQWLVR